MYQLQRPRFKFGLFLVEQQAKYAFQRNNGNMPVICYADSYEIKEDGSITFYHTVKHDDKRLKIPVLSYPQNKWEACVLLDSNNQYPVFTGQGSIREDTSSYTPPVVEMSEPPEPPEPSEPDNFSNNTNENDFDSLMDNMSGTPTIMPGTGNSGNNNSSSNNSYSGNSGAAPWDNTNQSNNSMPGISAANNPQEFKKAKNEWLEKHVKEYSKTNDSFIVTEFISYLNKDINGKTFKANETDVEWAAATLIKNRMVLGRKFSDKVTQKTLGLMLPDIMRRQWSGKMNPILEVLQEREETKNVTAIDLAVWMAQNNFT